MVTIIATSIYLSLTSFWIIVTKAAYFTNLPLFDDLKFSNNIIFTNQARSNLDCARLCYQTESCLTFTFSVTLNECQGHTGGIEMALGAEETDYENAVDYKFFSLQNGNIFFYYNNWVSMNQNMIP